MKKNRKTKPKSWICRDCGFRYPTSSYDWHGVCPRCKGGNLQGIYKRWAKYDKRLMGSRIPGRKLPNIGD